MVVTETYLNTTLKSLLISPFINHELKKSKLCECLKIYGVKKEMSTWNTVILVHKGISV